MVEGGRVHVAACPAGTWNSRRHEGTEPHNHGGLLVGDGDCGGLTIDDLGGGGVRGSVCATAFKFRRVRCADHPVQRFAPGRSAARTLPDFGDIEGRAGE